MEPKTYINKLINSNYFHYKQFFFRHSLICKTKIYSHIIAEQSIKITLKQSHLFIAPTSAEAYVACNFLRLMTA